MNCVLARMMIEVVYWPKCRTTMSHTKRPSLVRHLNLVLLLVGVYWLQPLQSFLLATPGTA